MVSFWRCGVTVSGLCHYYPLPSFVVHFFCLGPDGNRDRRQKRTKEKPTQSEKLRTTLGLLDAAIPWELRLGVTVLTVAMGVRSATGVLPHSLFIFPYPWVSLPSPLFTSLLASR